MVAAVRPVVQDEILRRCHRGAGRERSEAAHQGSAEPARPAAGNLHPCRSRTDASASGCTQRQPPHDAGQLDSPRLHRNLRRGTAQAGHRPPALHQDGKLPEEASATLTVFSVFSFQLTHHRLHRFPQIIYQHCHPEEL